uniref:Uncharacterized protein n=1 Tax=Kalanchoe fedtschenkoi TaxID=63787 RepID=A0A7N0V176_KALFE
MTCSSPLCLINPIISSSSPSPSHYLNSPPNPHFHSNTTITLTPAFLPPMELSSSSSSSSEKDTDSVSSRTPAHSSPGGVSSPSSPFHLCSAMVSPLLLSPLPSGSCCGDDHEKSVEEEEERAAAEGEEEEGFERLRFVDCRWEEVEHRFDRLCLMSRSGEPTITDSAFGYCIGLERSLEYAKELLRALRGRREQKFEITKSEIHDYWSRLTNPCFESRLHIFFNLCDADMDGRINSTDIKQVVTLSASTNKLSLIYEEAEAYTDLILEELDSANEGHIQLPQLKKLFKLRSTSRYISRSNQMSVSQVILQPDPCDLEPMSEAEILFRSNWRRMWIVSCWLIICTILFTWKFVQYQNRAAFQVMGYCLCTAKGSAETLKFNMALILLPVSRNTITWLRKRRWINSVIPFNDNINFHKLIAGGIVVGVILHGGTHLACDFPRICHSNKILFAQTIAAKFGNHQPSYFEILATTEVSSGITMVIIMAIAFLLATNMPRRQSASLPRSVRQVTGFNTFWYSHHLFIIVYVLLIIHSMFLFLTDNILEKTTWMYIAIPVMLYAGERICRIVRAGSQRVEILKANIYLGKVLHLKMCKPEGFKYHSGMYIFIQCPQISPYEWHPFSLTSGPEDEYLSVHIRTIGDWSYHLYNLFQEAILSGSRRFPRIYIDGPYGAASQDHAKYDVVLLIGLGIGVTPFISVLKDVISSHQKTQFGHIEHGRSSSIKSPSKVYLHWVTREHYSFAWFRDAMKEFSNSEQYQSVVEMNNHLTSVYKEGDARSVLISAIQALYRANKGMDVLSRTPIRTHFARPNWLKIFSDVADRHEGAQIGKYVDLYNREYMY